MNLSEEDKKSIHQFGTFLLSLDPNQFAAFAALIGLLLCQYLDEYSQESAGNFFETVGQIMLTVSAQKMTRDYRLKGKSS